MKRIKKSKIIFFHTLRLYRRKKNNLSPSAREESKEILDNLQQAIVKKDQHRANEYAKRAQCLSKTVLKKTFFRQCTDLVFSLLFALAVAMIIRSMWFELYEIPSGSMRPTFREKDHLTVSKTAFGINIPLMAKHIIFNPDLIKRNGIFIFTTKDMDIPDNDMLYFYLFPGKKQYIKRLIGKPGDTLYFYGGKIYGIDQHGNDITDELNIPLLNRIDHIPFIHFEGRTDVSSSSTNGIYSPITLRQMNEPIAKLFLTSTNQVRGELLSPYQNKGIDYFDLWGMKNYGVTRLLTKEQAKLFYSQAELTDAPFYLEVFHHPSIRHPMIEKDYRGRLRPSVGLSRCLLPLTEEYLRALFQNLYTSRFQVKDGIACWIGTTLTKENKALFCPALKGVPDGTYEFYYGQGMQVLFGGIIKKLSSNHPLTRFSIENIQTLFNLGIEWNNFFHPHSTSPFYLPSRYAYFREGDLYVMGTPLLKKGDPFLTDFIEQESLKQQNAPSFRPYFPFIDIGPPLKNGQLDVDLIRMMGLTIPSCHYLALGDNYAMSADSRDFGFVPEDNIRGTPSFIFWPLGNRWGPPVQPIYPFFTLPRSIIWVAAAILALIGLIWHHKKRRLPIHIE
jgi:signal peptidase I